MFTQDQTPRLVVTPSQVERSCPVQPRGTAPGIEELAAAGDGGPALPGQHGEVGHRGEAADVGGADVVSAMTNTHTCMH